ncbi:MAG: transcription elongation factor GreA [Chloroflexota bacterium]|jgi:transcription elongation factor GreA
MNKDAYLTPVGEKKLRDELEQLKTVEREAVAKRLREAIEMGDLSENADYHKAKEDQGFLEGRIQDLEHLLMNAVIIEDNSVHKDIVDVGATVTVHQNGEEDPETYRIVGAQESDPSNGRISNESPIGNAMLGRCVGDDISVQTPGGEITFKILKIE